LGYRIHMESAVMKKLLLILLLISGSLTSVFAQHNYAYGKFGAGEKFKLDIFYNWHFIWLNAGWVTFEIRDTSWNGQPAYHLFSQGATNTGYDWFYKVRDTYQAIVNKNDYLPYWFKCNTYEGGFWDNEEVSFNYQDSIAITKTENSKQPYRVDTLKITKNITDLLSAIYISRSVVFNQIKIGEKIPVPVIIGNKIYNLHFRYLGTELVTTRTGNCYRCRKFAVMMVDGTIFSGGEDLTAWITDDQNCAPVLLEAKIAVGSVKAFLVEMSGNRWPLENVIKNN